MAVCYVSDEGRQQLSAIPYEDERELQRVVADSPYLLAEDDEPEPVLVAREVALVGAGKADLVYLDQTGQITVVEVKLGRNSQSRREVVGQVFDYVSTLADHTLDELNALTSGGLDRALRSFVERDGENYDKLRQTCVKELRGGKVRVSVVVDFASESLTRIMAFLNEHSDLDVRLVEVGKHGREGALVYTSRALVVAQEEKSVGRRSRREMSEALSDVVEAFDALRPHGLTTVQRGRAAGYRQVRIPGWPKRYHYEFVDYAQGVAAEFHPEDRGSGASFIPTFQDLTPKLAAALPGCRVELNTTRRSGRGALIVRFPDGASAEAVASGMGTLVEVTRPKLTEEIRLRQ